MKNNSTGPVGHRQSVLFWMVLAAALTALSFLPVLKNGFTTWDDTSYVTRNPAIQTLSWTSVRHFFTVPEDFYRPLVSLSYALEYHFFGLNPHVYHATNLLLHLVNTALVFHLAALLGGAVPVCFLTAALFGIHPMHVESVAWITERKDMLYTLFFLASLIAYQIYRQKNKARFYLLSLLCFVLSGLSKPMAVSLPAVLILMDFFGGRKFDKESAVEKVPFFLAAVIFTGLMVKTQNAVGTLYFSDSLLVNFLTVFDALAMYAVKIPFPVGLSVMYPFPESAGYVLGPAVFSPFLIAALGGILFLAGRREPKIFFGLFFFLLTAAPVLQFIRNGWVVAADRYIYVPSIGLFFAASWIFYARLVRCKKKTRTALLIFIAAVLGCLSILTWQRCGIWKDSLTLYDDILKKNPELDIIRMNRANVFTLNGQPDVAVREYEKIVKSLPEKTGFSFYNDRGAAYLSKKDNEKALADLNQALTLKPRSFQAHNNRGVVYGQTGNFEKAIGEFNKVLYMNYACAYNNRGICYEKLGDLPNAITDFRRAIDIDPTGQPAKDNLRRALYLQKKIEETLRDLEKNNSPADKAKMLHNLGSLYADEEFYDKALLNFNRAVELDPSLAEAYNNRGSIYQIQGKNEEALSDYTKAAGLNSGFSEAYFNRALVLQELGRKKEAAEAYRQFLDICKNSLPALVRRAQKELEKL